MGNDGAPALGGFQAALDSRFRIHLDDSQPADASLVRVAVADRGSRWESFSLLFEGAGLTVPEGTHRVEHPDLGGFSLFLVPVLSEGNIYLEACFNRPLP